MTERTYDVTVTRTAIQQLTFKVKAENSYAAKDKAFELANNADFSGQEKSAEYTIEHGDCWLADPNPYLV